MHIRISCLRKLIRISAILLYIYLMHTEGQKKVYLYSFFMVYIFLQIAKCIQGITY